MSLDSLQTLSQVATLVGLIVVALGGFGQYYLGKEIEHEREIAASSRARDEFLRSLHFRQLDAYWVAAGPEEYQLALLAHILNKDATRALVFGNVRFSGTIQIGGGDASFTMRNLRIYDANAEVQGQYYLKPGTETTIALLLPTRVEMTIFGGVPGLMLRGTWEFTFEGSTFPTSPPAVQVKDVLSQEAWKKVAGS